MHVPVDKQYFLHPRHLFLLAHTEQIPPKLLLLCHGPHSVVHLALLLVGEGLPPVFTLTKNIFIRASLYTCFSGVSAQKWELLIPGYYIPF